MSTTLLAPAAAAPLRATPCTTPRCLNCDAPLGGPYCALCGQRDDPPRPTTRELLGEAWDESVSLDGRAARTLRLLVTRPGALTADQLSGRRARYVRPLRLYLLCSAAYFLADGVLPMPVAARAEHARLATVAAAEQGGRGAATPACEPRRPGEGEVSWTYRRIDCRAERAGPRFERAMERNHPRLIFALFAVFAAIVGLFFRGPTYPEHLYFALHVHAFGFLVGLVDRAAEAALPPAVMAAVSPILFSLLVAYGVTALRRVYGRSWGGTLGRGVAVAAIYGLVFLAALAGVLAATALLL